MEFLPRSLGTRPRLACEVRAEGVVAARAEDALAVLSAIAQAPLADQIVIPRLHAVDASEATVTPSGVGGDAAGRAAVVAAVRKALEAVALRSREVTLIVPDAAVRVLLLDFDELPAKPAEALPVVRFRLKKLLPFDADDAAVSYQVMATAKGLVHVLAVAMPRRAAGRLRVRRPRGRLRAGSGTAQHPCRPGRSARAGCARAGGQRGPRRCDHRNREGGSPAAAPHRRSGRRSAR